MKDHDGVLHTIPFNKPQREKFQKIATYIRKHLKNSQDNVKRQTTSIPEQIQKLSELKDKGIVTTKNLRKRKQSF